MTYITPDKGPWSEMPKCKKCGGVWAEGCRNPHGECPSFGKKQTTQIPIKPVSHVSKTEVKDGKLKVTFDNGFQMLLDVPLSDLSQLAEKLGCAVVPLEPTREMWAAGGDAVIQTQGTHHDNVSGAIYTAMIAAARVNSETEEK